MARQNKVPKIAGQSCIADRPNRIQLIRRFDFLNWRARVARYQSVSTGIGGLLEVVGLEYQPNKAEPPDERVANLPRAPEQDSFNLINGSRKEVRCHHQGYSTIIDSQFFPDFSTTGHPEVLTHLSRWRGRVRASICSCLNVPRQTSREILG